MSNRLTEYLIENYIETAPLDFYRDIFPKGDLQEKGKYNGILVEVTSKKKKDGRNKVFRYTVTDDLEIIKDVIERGNFCLMSPISYIGKERNSDNARILYALAVDLDGIIIRDDGDPFGLRTLFHQINNIERLPNPTYIVSSGTGLHLYYVFEEPIMLFKNVVRKLQKYKKELTRLIWQGYITELEDNVQYESLFQGFRMVGTITKKGERARAFKTGERVTMEYMNKFVNDDFKAKEFTYKSSLTLEKAKEKYPKWYEDRIIRKKPKGTWTVNRAVYDWWKKRIVDEAKTGHRYYCLMMLAVYARRADIDRDELERDAFYFMELFDQLPATEDNPFDEKDVIDSLQAYEDRYITYPINSISYLTDINIEKNKRNYRKRAQHIKIMNAIRDIEYADRNWRNKDGRPKGSGTKEQIIKEYRKSNPMARKSDCIRDTGISKMTVYKWWD